MVPCEGMKAWQSVQVPQDLRETIFKEKGITRAIRTSGRQPKREKERTKAADGEQSWVEVIEEETTVTKTKKRVQKKRIDDASQWTRASDDDYQD